MTVGMFTRLVNGDLPRDGKKWPSEGGNGRVFVVTSCTGQFSTTSVPLTTQGGLTGEHAENRAKLEVAAAEKLAALGKT